MRARALGIGRRRAGGWDFPSLAAKMAAAALGRRGKGSAGTPRVAGRRASGRARAQRPCRSRCGMDADVEGEAGRGVSAAREPGGAAESEARPGLSCPALPQAGVPTRRRVFARGVDAHRPRASQAEHPDTPGPCGKADCCTASHRVAFLFPPSLSALGPASPACVHLSAALGISRRWEKKNKIVYPPQLPGEPRRPAVRAGFAPIPAISHRGPRSSKRSVSLPMRLVGCRLGAGPCTQLSMISLTFWHMHQGSGWVVLACRLRPENLTDRRRQRLSRREQPWVSALATQ